MYPICHRTCPDATGGCAAEEGGRFHSTLRRRRVPCPQKVKCSESSWENYGKLTSTQSPICFLPESLDKIDQPRFLPALGDSEVQDLACLILELLRDYSKCDEWDHSMPTCRLVLSWRSSSRARGRCPSRLTSSIAEVPPFCRCGTFWSGFLCVGRPFPVRNRNHIFHWHFLMLMQWHFLMFKNRKRHTAAFLESPKGAENTKIDQHFDGLRMGNLR